MTDTKGKNRLVVLLVVLGLVLGTGILIGVPFAVIAVQHARETSRREQCIKNLKQMQLALENYEKQQAPQAGPNLADALAVIKSKQFVDLTHAFEPGIPHWPGFPDEKRETLYWYDGGKGRWARASSPSSSRTSASGARTAIHQPISSRASEPSTRSTPRK